MVVDLQLQRTGSSRSPWRGFARRRTNVGQSVIREPLTHMATYGDTPLAASVAWDRYDTVMSPSSRTPEGEPNHCDVCGYDQCIEPSLESRDATCPNCGALLWFPDATPEEPETPDWLRRYKLRDRVFYLAIQKFGWPIPLDVDVSFVAKLPQGDGAAWFAALDQAQDWADFGRLMWEI